MPASLIALLGGIFGSCDTCLLLHEVVILSILPGNCLVDTLHQQPNDSFYVVALETHVSVASTEDCAVKVASVVTEIHICRLAVHIHLFVR